ncbi:MAG: hypothetical protein K2K63_18120 [Acetatifactor sp.]|nr:hypothetical protein [Acetatifactor sp.]
MEELMILRQMEFQVLAAALGIEEIFGVRPRKDMSCLGQSELLYIILEMAQKGILKPNGRKYEVQEPWRTMMCSIGEAGKILAVENREERAVTFFFGRELICLEESAQDADAVRIGMYAPEECYRLLEEKGFLPPPHLEADLAALQTEEEAKDWFAGVTAPGDDIPFICHYRIFDGFKILQDDFYLVDNPCNYWIVRKSGEELRFSRYDGGLGSLCSASG